MRGEGLYMPLDIDNGIEQKKGVARGLRMSLVSATHQPRFHSLHPSQQPNVYDDSADQALVVEHLPVFLCVAAVL